MEESQIQICLSVVNSQTLARHFYCPATKGEWWGFYQKYKLLLNAEDKAGLGRLLRNSSRSQESHRCMSILIFEI